jgi:uncharacterized protein YjdB
MLGRKILAIALAAVLVFGLLQAIAPQAAYAASGTYNIVGTDSVATIQSGIQTKIDAATSGDIVTVTGSKNNADTTLTLDIPAGVTVTWSANYSGNSSTYMLIDIFGEGAFEVRAGNIEATSNGQTAILSDGVTISVTGGRVKGGDNGEAITTYDSIHIGGTAQIISTGMGNAIYMLGDATPTTFTMDGGTVSSENQNAVFLGSGSMNISAIITGGTISNNTNGSSDVVYAAGEADLIFQSGGKITSGGSSPGHPLGVSTSTTSIAIAKKGTETVYLAGTTEDLAVMPSGASALWAIQGGKSGITYANGANVGFIEAVGITVVTSFILADSVTISGAPKLAQHYQGGKGNTVQLAATVLPANTTRKSLTWSSNNQGIATVDANGLVTLKGSEGTVKITATAKDGSGKKHEVSFGVAEHITKVRTPLTTLYIQKGKSLKIPVALDDSSDLTKAVSSKLTWKSSNIKVLKVDKNGKITAAKKITKKTKVKVTVTAANGKALKLTVYVVPKASAHKGHTIKGLPKGNKLAVGKTAVLTPKLKNAKATTLKVTYKSSNAKVLSVDNAGMIVAKKKGTAIISIKVGSKTVKTKKITVK